MEEKKNIKMVLQYDGTRYHGWQRQEGASTIQGILEERIQRIIGEPVTLIASGRTDAGVHALHQVCHFITRSNLHPDSLRRGLNSVIPHDIRVKEAEYARQNFHARYSARSKTYEYRILNRLEPDLFLRFYTWHVPFTLDLVKMNQCISLLRGKHDFSSFKSSGSGNVNPVREMMLAELQVSGQDLLRFVFEADGFLRHMVRNMVGTVVDVGQGRITVEAFEDIFRSRDRQMAGIKAPPEGLFLAMVKYGQQLKA
jgi:tRNA pseudouridine38-40 synthase